MRLFAIGLSHHTAPLDLRERVDFARAGFAPALAALTARGVAREIVVVSTCNRAEIYAATDTDAGADALASFFSDYHQVPSVDLQPHLYVHRGAQAARHLFRVTAGLDSLVVGEPQIMGQVKNAYTAATEEHCTGALLNRLFHTAFTAGKRVRSETGLGEGAVSVSYAAISLAKKIFRDLTSLRVLILGGGEMAMLTGVHLRAQEVKQIVVSSRTRSTAEELAREIEADVAEWDMREQALVATDIVITATGAPHAILSRQQIAHVMSGRRERPLFIIDIALPRDVEADAGTLDQVFLYNIDDLQSIVQENLAKRGAELAHAEQIVEEETNRFAAWMQSREIIPTVVALRQRFEAIRRAELARLQQKFSSLPPEAHAHIDQITRLIVEKLLLTPTEQLKAVSDDALAAYYSDALSRLFSLAPEGVAEEDAETSPRKARPS